VFLQPHKPPKTRQPPCCRRFWQPPCCRAEINTHKTADFCGNSGVADLLPPPMATPLRPYKDGGVAGRGKNDFSPHVGVRHFRPEIPSKSAQRRDRAN